MCFFDYSIRQKIFPKSIESTSLSPQKNVFIFDLGDIKSTEAGTREQGKGRGKGTGNFPKK